MVAVMLLNMLVYNQFFNPKAQQTEVTSNQFLEDLNAKVVDTVQVNQDVIYYTRRGSDSSARLPDWIISSGSSSHVYYTVAMNDPDLVNRLYQAGATLLSGAAAGNLHLDAAAGQSCVPAATVLGAGCCW